MSLGRKLSLHAGAALRSDERGVARSRGQHEAIARPQWDTFAAGEDEIDRPARAIQDFRVAVFVFGVRIARRVRPSVDVTGFAAERSLEGPGIGRRKSAVPTMLGAHR